MILILMPNYRLSPCTWLGALSLPLFSVFSFHLSLFLPSLFHLLIILLYLSVSISIHSLASYFSLSMFPTFVISHIFAKVPLSVFAFSLEASFKEWLLVWSKFFHTCWEDYTNYEWLFKTVIPSTYFDDYFYKIKIVL